jgi:hypothetical protein
MAIPPNPLAPSPCRCVGSDLAWITLASDPTSANTARRFAGSTLSGHNDDFKDTVTLVVSELVTNAYEAIARSVTNPETEVIRFGIHCTPRWAHILVRDPIPEQPTRREANEMDEYGRGLAIVETYALLWTHGHPGGKTVHAAVTIPGVVLTQPEINALAVP